VVKAEASENQDFLNKILDTDAGSRRLGEFAIGTNKMVKTYMNNVLFDEKMYGTVHMAIGEAYEECRGINKSAIHMDIVKDMTEKGSSVTVDGKVVLRDGKILV
jgi:aminopeptidase